MVAAAALFHIFFIFELFRVVSICGGWLVDVFFLLVSEKLTFLLFDRPKIERAINLQQEMRVDVICIRLSSGRCALVVGEKCSKLARERKKEKDRFLSLDETLV